MQLCGELQMGYIWPAVIAIIAAAVYYCGFPLVLFPVLLFAVFLASGGKSFPRVFFRTVVRDLR